MLKNAGFRFLFCCSLFLIVTQISGCGFRLRGHEPLPEQLHHIGLVGDLRDRAFIDSLGMTLQQLNVHITKPARTASIVLEIISNRLSQQFGAIAANTTTRQYTLISTVNYRLASSDGKTIAGPFTVSSVRTLVVNANQILSSSSEADTLHKEMRQELIFKMLNRLRSRNTRLALQTWQAHPVKKP